jgi:hypothetical protein
MRRIKKMSCERSIFRSISQSARPCLSPSLTVLPETLFCPKGLMGEHEKGDLDEGHVVHQKWSGVRYKVGGVDFNYEERLLKEIIILKIN